MFEKAHSIAHIMNQSNHRRLWTKLPPARAIPVEKYMRDCGFRSFPGKHSSSLSQDVQMTA